MIERYNHIIIEVNRLGNLYSHVQARTPIAMPHAEPEPDTVLRGHAAEVTSAAFAPTEWDATNPPLLLSAALDGDVRIWSLTTRRPLASVAAHRAAVLAVCPLADGRVLSQGRDGVARIWDARDGMRGPLLELPSKCYNFCQCACSPALALDGTLLESTGDAAATPCVNDSISASLPVGLIAMPSEDAQRLVLWDVRQRSPARTLAPSESLGRAGMCMCTRFGREGSWLLSGWEDGSLQSFDLRGTGTPPSSRRLHREPLLCVDLDAKGTHAISGSADCALHVSPIGDGVLGEPVATLDIPVSNESSGSGGLQSLRARPDGRILAAGGWDGRVRIWQWRDFKPLAVLRHHTGTVNAVDFSACSRWMATASNDRTIALWSLFPPKESSSKGSKSGRRQDTV